MLHSDVGNGEDPTELFSVSSEDVRGCPVLGRSNDTGAIQTPRKEGDHAHCIVLPALEEPCVRDLY